MLNSALCETATAALDGRSAGRLDALRDVTAGAGAGRSDRGQLREAAEGFASLFYGALVKEMLASVRDEEDDGPVAAGVQGFVAMFLPQAVSASPADPLASYIEAEMEKREGEGFDERA